ncbi:zinc-binding dehydrogenase [Massilia sp. CCM 9210]|uniref:zinc-binding dehydrogenase n=1 Tax=Massilia scottii TaxID=3057166 RepID=UPI00279671B3|nr:zinc-binding dehydrogenase [Massilia sp. CCM 9210]MDQ1812307.1 zinc-binding dehydrogenase [Massilia sp. CCM 9210]
MENVSKSDKQSIARRYGLGTGAFPVHCLPSVGPRFYAALNHDIFTSRIATHPSRCGKIAHALGAAVTVLSQSLSKKEDGLRFGAASNYAANDKESFTRLAGQFDLIINTVGAAVDWNDYIRLLKIDGPMTLMGVPDAATAPVNAFNMMAHAARWLAR